MRVKWEPIMEIDKGMIETFLEQVPEKAFHLSLRLVLAALAFLIGIQLIRIIRHVLKKTMKRGKVDESARHFIDSFVKFSLYFILVLTVGAGLGVDATSILALLGSAGVAIGLAVQGSLGNLIGGVMILILKPFTTGDYIKDGQGNEGTVDTIDVIYTQLRSYDNKVIVLPNGNLANGSITNFTKCRERRIDIAVGIAYESDIRTAREAVLELLDGDRRVLKDREKLVIVDSLGNSGVNLNVRCWALKEDFWETKWELTERIKYTLDEENIKIPYPQMEVHMNS